MVMQPAHQAESRGRQTSEDVDTLERRPTDRHWTASPEHLASRVESEPPSKADVQVMVALSIVFEAGTYRFAAKRYESLDDALIAVVQYWHERRLADGPKP